MQTFSEENYLKAIYLIERRGVKITPTAISEALNNNPASVVDMLRKLVEKSLIHYDKKRGVRLTEKGRNVAISIVRKHRLWESFLVEKLGYQWDEVHDIAEELEHVKNSSIADRLDKYLNFPQFDPHGDPIPKANGETAVISKTLLSEMEEGQVCHIVNVKDTTPSFLQYLKKLGVGLGTKITVVEKIPFDNSVIITIGNNKEHITVSNVFAEGLIVKP